MAEYRATLFVPGGILRHSRIHLTAGLCRGGDPHDTQRCGGAVQPLDDRYIYVFINICMCIHGVYKGDAICTIGIIIVDVLLTDMCNHNC